MPPRIPLSDGPVSVYVHWPFCISKCPYCDFNSHVRDRIDESRYHAAYLQELNYYASLLKARGVGTVFFGGGTPSLMDPELTRALLDTLRPWFAVPVPEITLEANPSSAETSKLRAFRRAGVNRLSLGIQSLREEALTFLGRAHGKQEALHALESARDVFGERFSFDLIYARPGQTLDEWRRELNEALPLAGDHLSLYQLTIERGTPFFHEEKEGRLNIPDGDTAADLYEMTQAMTKEAGYPRYEISNHARPGAESRHNLQYWRYLDYIGIGAGGCGRYATATGKRTATTTWHAPEKWLDAVERGGNGVQKHHEVTPEEAATETIMTGLRLEEGMQLSRLEETGGAKAKETLLSAAEPLATEGLVELAENNTRLKCTRTGFLLADAVIRHILENMRGGKRC